MRESDFYPRVAAWAKKHFLCFKTAVNVGLKYSRVDVLGVRDVGGDLSGDVETIAIEVKRGAEPFATASGQALGYKVYANRVYLADRRETGFNASEIAIASHLGIGLVQIMDRGCREVLSSPLHIPVPRLGLALLECMTLGRCQLCSSFFETGADKAHRYSRLTRENIRRAIGNERGLMFWNCEVADRKRRLGIRRSEEGASYERRFVCPECVTNILGQVTAARSG